MKKIVIALATLFAVALSANAQVGVIAGLTSSATNFKTAVAEAKSINQYHVSVAYKFGIGDFFAVQPALVYNMKGTKIGDIKEISEDTFDYKTGYVELPVQLQAGVSIADAARIYAIAEPFVGYAVTNKLVLGDTVEDTWDNVKNKLEYGVGVGFGVEVLDHVQISAKYFWNLGTVYGASKESILSDLKGLGESTCNGVAVSVGFFF